MENKKKTYLFIHRREDFIPQAYEEITDIEIEKYIIGEPLTNANFISLMAHKGHILSIIKNVNLEQKDTFEHCFSNNHLVHYKLEPD